MNRFSSEKWYENMLFLPAVNSHSALIESDLGSVHCCNGHLLCCAVPHDIQSAVSIRSFWFLSHLCRKNDIRIIFYSASIEWYRYFTSVLGYSTTIAGTMTIIPTIGLLPVKFITGVVSDRLNILSEVSYLSSPFFEYEIIFSSGLQAAPLQLAVFFHRCIHLNRRCLRSTRSRWRRRNSAH